VPPLLPGAAEIRQIVRMALGSALAWWAGRLLGASRPAFAVLAVIVSLQGNPFGSLRLAGQRLVGVLAGVAIGVAALRVPGPSPPVVGLLVLASLAAGSRLRFGPELNTQVAISALLLLAVGHSWRYGLERLWETAMGGAVAVAVSAVLWPVDPLAEFRSDLRRLRRRWAAGLPTLAAAFGGAPARPVWRRLRGAAVEAERRAAEIPALEDALRWNPWGDEAGLRRVRAEAECVAALHRHARTLARVAVEARRRPGAGLPPADLQALRTVLEACATASGALEGALGAEEARGRLAEADRGIAAVVAGSPGAGLAAAAVASELGHIAADLRAWLVADVAEGQAADGRAPV